MNFRRLIYRGICVLLLGRWCGIVQETLVRVEEAFLRDEIRESCHVYQLRHLAHLRLENKRNEVKLS